MKKIAVVIISVLALMTVHSPAHAGDWFYGQKASAVAKQLDCKNFKRTGPGAFNQDAGVCYIDGWRLNVITFKNIRQQDRWNTQAMVAFSFFKSRECWANGWGVTVVSKKMDRASAVKGKSVLRPGKVICA